jgi:hypothetical protein
MSVYFTRMQKLREHNKLDSRIRFMIQVSGKKRGLQPRSSAIR